MDEGRRAADGVSVAQARQFLSEHYDERCTDVEPAGAGAWSQCFGFRVGAEELVARFGRYVDDFHKDRLAHSYAAPDLPIPEVRAVGPAFDGYYAVSTRVRGVVLETLGAGAWRAVVPSLAAALEAMRTAEPRGPGYGGWGGDGQASHATWSAHLLSAAEDTPDRRTYGWRARLAQAPGGEESFAWGLELLRRLVDDAPPRSVIHGDLINRNALVDGARLSGVFDWGCSAYGDHLYDLAWFEFWGPWTPELDMALLRGELEGRWRRAGYWPQRYAERLLACHLHIGLDHLAYNAYLGDWKTLAETAARMRTVAAGAV